MNDAIIKKAAVSAAVLVVVLYFAMLGSYSLIDPDEGRYAEIPREMIESGDFITPRLNYVKYYEKPPLLYWMVSASFCAFGENEFAARFPCVLCALLCAGITWALGRKMFGRTAGLIGGAVTATSILFFAIGRLCLTDMPLTLFLTASAASYWCAVSAAERKSARIYSALFWISMGLGVLTKGLVAIVLPCGTIVLHCIITRSARGIRSVASPIGVALFAAVTVPYFYAVCSVDPEYFDFFFIREHFLRYTTTVHNRYEPMWFFVPIVIMGMMPWTGWLPSIFARGSALRYRETRGAAGYLLLWCGVVLAFFSLSNSKLIPYVVPCLPPLAILIGVEFARMIERKRWHVPSLVCSTLLNVIFAAALVIYAQKGKYIPPSEAIPTASAAALSLVVGCVAAIALSIKKRAYASAVAALFVTAALFFASLTEIWITIGRTRGLEGVAAAITQDRPDATIAAWNDVVQGLSYYARARVMNVGGPGELEFGYEREAIEDPDAEKYLVTPEEFADLWESGRPIALVIDTDIIEHAGLSAVRRTDIEKRSILFNY